MSDICLSDLLFSIEKKRVEFSLGPLLMLRNYEGLPATKPGNDIDLIVRSSELESWQGTFEDVANDLGIQLENTLKDYYFRSYVFSDANGEIVKIDLNFAFIWRGVKFADVDQVVDSAESYSVPIFVASEAYDRAFITFCHSFLYGGFIKRRYLTEFAEQLCEGPGFYRQLVSVFGRHSADLLKDCILSGQIEMPRRQANSIRIAAFARAIVRNPVSTAIGFAKSLQGPVDSTGQHL